MKKVAQMPLKLLVIVLIGFIRVLISKTKIPPKMKQNNVTAEMSFSPQSQGMTQVSLINLSQQEAKEEVCRLLDWTEDQYCPYQYVCGIDYIRRYFVGAEKLIWAAERSRMFWNWWKLRWLDHDQFYLANISQTSSHYEGRIIYYRAAHDVEVLAAIIYPDAVVRNDLYKILGIPLRSKYYPYVQENKKTA